MTRLRSGTEVSSHNPRPQNTSRAPIHPDTARNIRYLRQARQYERITGDSPATLRQKRRWLYNEHVAGRISGKALRELNDFYSKGNISKPKHKLPKVRNLSEIAQSIKHQLDVLFNDGPVANSVAGAMDESRDNTSRDAGEGPSGAAKYPQDSDSNSHRALGESSNGRVFNEPPHEGAVDTVAGAHIKLEDNTDAEDDTETETETETEDESSSDGEELSNRTSQAAVAPANTAEANDAAARQRILELGLELADQSVAGQEAQTGLGDMDELKVKREEEANE